MEQEGDCNGSSDTFSISDREIQKLREQDEQMWLQTVDIYDELVRDAAAASLHRHNLSLDLTDDIVQKTWETVVRRIQDFEFRGPESFFHWIRKIIFNHVRRAKDDGIRNAQCEIQWQDLESDDQGYAPAEERLSIAVSTSTPEDYYLEQTGYALIDALITSKLEVYSPRNAAILRLWMEDIPRKDIALKFGISPEVVSTVIYRSINLLRPYFSEFRE